MNTTSLESILSALANHASCYTTRGSICGFKDNLVSWALDKTGMVDTSLFIYIKDLSDGKCDSCEERHISHICVLFPHKKGL
jgi:hypothetical protein